MEFNSIIINNNKAYGNYYSEYGFHCERKDIADAVLNKFGYDVDEVEYVLYSDCVLHHYMADVEYDYPFNTNGVQDTLQYEYSLSDNELYLVTYHSVVDDLAVQLVDIGITKKEIINNVLANKYIYGAEYYTMGQAMKSTKDFLEEVEKYKARKKRESYTNDQLAELCEQIVFNRNITSQFVDEEYEMLEVIAERLKDKE